MTGLSNRQLRAQTIWLAPLALILTVGQGQGASKNSGAPIVLASGGHARVAVVLGEESSEHYRFAADELARYLRTLSGADVAIVSNTKANSLPSGDGLIVLGGSDVNKTAAEATRALGMNFEQPQAGWISHQERPFQEPRGCSGSGQQPGISTLYAVYELVERLGSLFNFASPAT